MKFINVTDDIGTPCMIAVRHILTIRPRPRTELGSVIRFSNGTSMNVIESVENVIRQATITEEACCDHPGHG